MKTTIILADSKPFRSLMELELEAVPLPGEHISFGGRTYQALERSWRFELASELPGLGDAPPVPVPSVGLLVRQLSGPPHVLTSLGGVPN